MRENFEFGNIFKKKKLDKVSCYLIVEYSIYVCTYIHTYMQTYEKALHDLSHGGPFSSHSHPPNVCMYVIMYICT